MKKVFTKITAIAMAALMMSPVFATSVMAKEPVNSDTVSTNDGEIMVISEADDVVYGEECTATSSGVQKLYNYVKQNGVKSDGDNYYGSMVYYEEGPYSFRFNYQDYTKVDWDLETMYVDIDTTVDGKYCSIVYSFEDEGMRMMNWTDYKCYCRMADGDNELYSDDMIPSKYTGSINDFTVKKFKGENADLVQYRKIANETLNIMLKYINNKMGISPAELGFASYGKIATTTITPGWKSDTVGYKYLNSDGTYAKGWKQLNNLWYYFDTNGYMVKGWKKIGSNWYYFSPSNGNMWTGWHLIDGKWYSFDKANGYMHTGWKQFNGLWYHLNPSSGAMAQGWAQIGSDWYLFSTNGNMYTGWHQVGTQWFYLNKTTGKMVTKAWQDNCYLQADGSMAVNKWIGNKYVGANGKVTKTK